MFPVRDKNTGATKYISRSKATVLDNKDPMKRGRVRVDHPLLGQTGWIPYLRTNSTFDPPQVGDIVYVESDAGVHNYPVAWGNLTKGMNDGSSGLQQKFQRNVPTNRGWATPGGNSIELDDGLDTSADPGTPDIGIRVKTPGNNSVELSDTNKQIKIKESGTAELNLQNGKVALGASSTELLQEISDQLQQLITAFTSEASHTHIGNLGYPTAPPSNAGDMSSAASQLSTIKGKIDGIKGSL